MDDLTLHPRDRCTSTGPLVVIGEVLWDVFPDSARLGGAPLNFAVHALRLGLYPLLISALAGMNSAEEPLLESRPWVWTPGW